MVVSGVAWVGLACHALALVGAGVWGRVIVGVVFDSWGGVFFCVWVVGCLFGVWWLICLGLGGGVGFGFIGSWLVDFVGVVGGFLRFPCFLCFWVFWSWRVVIWMVVGV